MHPRKRLSRPITHVTNRGLENERKIPHSPIEKNKATNKSKKKSPNWLTLHPDDFNNFSAGSPYTQI